jgi:ferredoxin-NADP reductase
MLDSDQLELHPEMLTTDLGEEEFDLIVESRVDVATDIASFTLRLADDAELPAWTPGAHIDVLIPEIGPRQFSLCGDPSDRRRWRIAVLNEADGRGGSRYVHANLTNGSTVRVRGPRNHFRFEPSEHYVFIAGGIGITPLLPMIAEAERIGADWRAVYGGRQASTLAFTHELAAYEDRVTLWPQDERGLIDVAGLVGTAPAGSKIYCCGPEALLEAVEREHAGGSVADLHVERFIPKPVGEPAQTGSFEVELRRSGMTLTVPPERSILEVVAEAGVYVLSSCEVGTCGTCETPVLEGTPEHRDSILEEDEQEANDCMMICVSRCIGKGLVLDL